MTTQSKNPRVLVVEAAPALGGSMTSIEVVIRKGQEEGIDFHVLSRFPCEAFLPRGVRHFRFPSGDGLRGIAMDAATTLWRSLRHSYDVVLLNNILSANFPSVIASLLGQHPVIQLVRDYERASRSWTYLSPLVDAFVPVSQSVANRLRELGVDESKLHLAHEGIALPPLPTSEEKTEQREKWGIPIEADVVGFVGRLVPWKGYDLFLEAAIASAKKRPSLHVLIVGGATPESEKQVKAYKDLLKTYGLADRFHFTGMVPPDDARRLFAALDLFVHSSETPEPFGRVLLEAMSLGIPTISSSLGGPEEIITSGVDGIRTTSEVDSLAAALDECLDAPERTRQLGAQGRQTVSTRFHEDVCASPVLSLIHSLSKRSQGCHTAPIKS
jgi:glycosyltransferase involved in cell wall biosynthesis